MGESLLLTELGPVLGLTLLIALAFMRGWIVPGVEMQYWRKAFFEEQDQKRQLLDATRVTQSVLKALPTEESRE